MNDKIVTHEDLDALRNIRTEVCRPNNHPTGCTCPGSELLDRLIAAAEADQPPLPEGWVSFYDAGQLAFRHLWHSGRGNLYTHDQPMAHFLVGKVGDDDLPRDRLSPLRPTVTEADVEKAVDVYMEARGLRPWRQTRDEISPALRAAFEAAGIEVVTP